MYLVRLSIFLLASAATILGGGLRGRVICFADDHVAVERPHKPRTCDRHTCEHLAPAQDDHGPCQDFTADEPEARPASPTAPDLGDLPLIPLLLSIPADRAGAPSSGSPFHTPPPPTGPDPWASACLRTVILLI